MTLSEALDWLMEDKNPWTWGHIANLGRGRDAEAIATILNAVVKGELRHDNDR